METKAIYKIIGMQRDLCESMFNSNYAYENKNIRIYPTNESTLMALSNEQGTGLLHNYINEITLTEVIKYENIIGIPVGQAVLNNIIILFTHNEYNIIDSHDNITYKDYIYIINYDTQYGIYGALQSYVFYKGNLGFTTTDPLECISYYENDNVLKVYFTDGINSPRLINIANYNVNLCKIYADTFIDSQFDFSLNLDFSENISITKNSTGGIGIHSGVIQYCFTYSNKYGPESSIFYDSSLYYITAEHMGLSAEEISPNSFTININNVNIKYDYINIYAILRTTLDDSPNVRKVGYIKINKNNLNTYTYTFIDTGQGTVITPQNLLYVGCEDLTLYTWDHKDNTLFYGNVKLNKPIIKYKNLLQEYFNDPTIITIFKTDENKQISNSDPTDNYQLIPNYKFQLNEPSSVITTFKYDEYYRFGIQFQYKNGKWSEPIWLFDKKNTIIPKTNYISYAENCKDKLVSFFLNVKASEYVVNLNSDDLTYLNEAYNQSQVAFQNKINEILSTNPTIYNIDKLKIFLAYLYSIGYRRIRPLVVYPKYTDKNVLCQGVINPTVFNANDRINKNTYSLASWFFRPIPAFNYNKFIDYDSRTNHNGFHIVNGDPSAGFNYAGEYVPAEQTNPLYGDLYAKETPFWIMEGNGNYAGIDPTRFNNVDNPANGDIIQHFEGKGSLLPKYITNFFTEFKEFNSDLFSGYNFIPETRSDFDNLLDNIYSIQSTPSISISKISIFHNTYTISYNSSTFNYLFKFDFSIEASSGSSSLQLLDNNNFILTGKTNNGTLIYSLKLAGSSGSSDYDIIVKDYYITNITIFSNKITYTLVIPISSNSISSLIQNTSSTLSSTLYSLSISINPGCYLGATTKPFVEQYSVKSDTSNSIQDMRNLPIYGSILESRHMMPLGISTMLNAEIQNMEMVDGYAGWSPKAENVTRTYLSYNRLCPINDFNGTKDLAEYAIETNNKNLHSADGPLIITDDNIETQISKYKKWFYVDDNICTINSPDIEFDSGLQAYIKNLSSNPTNFKIKIIGIIPITSFNSHYYFGNLDSKGLTPTHINDKDYYLSVTNIQDTDYFENQHSLKEPGTLISNDSISRYGFKTGSAFPCWKDHAESIYRDPDDYFNFMVYPFSTSKSMVNAREGTSKIASKTLTNIRFSSNTLYFEDEALNYVNNYYFNNERTLSKETLQSSNLDEHSASIYDLDALKILLPTDLGSCILNDNNIYNASPDLVYSINSRGAYGNTCVTFNTGDESSTEFTGGLTYLTSLRNLILYNKLGYKVNNSKYDRRSSEDNPVSINFKSNPHIVIKLKSAIDNSYFQEILPTLNFSKRNADGSYQYEKILHNRNISFYNRKGKDSKIYQSKLIFDDIDSPKIKGYFQRIFNYDFNNRLTTEYGTKLLGLNTGYDCSPTYGFLWLVELINTTVTDANRFGGQTSQAFKTNQWIPGGEPVKLNFTIDNQTGTVTSIPSSTGVINLIYNEGDTYFQRYDCLKTYPNTDNNGTYNNIQELLSFKIQTNINIDSKYDLSKKNHINIINFHNIQNEKFNLINNVYNQKRTFFPQPYLDEEDFNNNTFKNLVSWTDTKVNGELIDKWTNLTLLNTLDMDGDKGAINKIKRYKNDLFLFQDTAIANILFNTRTQITTNESTPIQIANSGKVDGKIYINDIVGCINKWSIVVAESGLWFIDDITKGIYNFSDKFTCVSDELGFHSWINQQSSPTKFTPKSFDQAIINNTSANIPMKSFISYYDKINGDIFFINENNCLCFSEGLKQFSSFYSYDRTPFAFNTKDNFIFIHRAMNSNSILNNNTTYYFWKAQAGQYNSYFNKVEDYYIELICNPDSYVNKIYDNLEFQLNCYSVDLINDSTTLLPNEAGFNLINCKTDLQEGTKSIKYTNNRYDTSLKKKFNFFRTTLPRDNVNANYRDRLCGPYLRFRFSNNANITESTSSSEAKYYKMVLQNLNITYAQ